MFKRHSVQRCYHDPPLEHSKKSVQAHAKIQEISWWKLPRSSGAVPRLAKMLQQRTS